MKSYTHELIVPPRRAILAKQGIIILGGREYKISGESKQASAFAKDEANIPEALIKLKALEEQYL